MQLYIVWKLSGATWQKKEISGRDNCRGGTCFITFQSKFVEKRQGSVSENLAM